MRGGTLFALEEEAAGDAGGREELLLRQLARAYRPGDGGCGICFDYAVHDAILRRDGHVMDRMTRRFPISAKLRVVILPRSCSALKNRCCAAHQDSQGITNNGFAASRRHQGGNLQIERTLPTGCDSLAPARSALSAGKERGIYAASPHAYQHAQIITNAFVPSHVEAT